VELDDHYIELIQAYPCKSQKELRDREGFYVKLYLDKCVNKGIPGGTDDYYTALKSTYYN